MPHTDLITRAYLLPLWTVLLMMTAGASPSDSSLVDTADTIDSCVVVTFISDPPGAQVTLDDSVLGVTPLTRDSVEVGPHRIVGSLAGYRTFSKNVSIPPGKEKRVKFRLTQIVNRLSVTSRPAGATVILNDSAWGITPFLSTTIRPDVYKLKVALEGYLPYVSEVTVYGKEPTSLSCALTSVAYADSVRASHQRAFRITRRILFATGASSFFLAGMLYNGKIADAVADEERAYQAYNTDGLTQSEYDIGWLNYQNERRAAGDYTRSRNALYVLGVLCAAGFAISIPF